MTVQRPRLWSRYLGPKIVVPMGFPPGLWIAPYCPTLPSTAPRAISPCFFKPSCKENPWLALMVQRIALARHKVARSSLLMEIHLDYERWKTPVTAEPILRKAVEPFCIDSIYEQEMWLRELLTGSLDRPLISLLVFSMPRLEKLELELPGHLLSELSSLPVCSSSFLAV
ncbi:hypothetical protein BDFG_01268 [Blastomyces dermatitidis ATCC 26199]|nr:hypothetical protein BDFG_01268 [Blastomyces dermatitidis ATCC 26199]